MLSAQKVVRTRVNQVLSFATRPLSTSRLSVVEDNFTDFDRTSIPSGIDVPILDESVTHWSATVNIDPRPMVGNGTQYVYAYNLPLAVSEVQVRQALCNIGNPDSVFVYDVLAGGPQVKNSLYSSMNAVLGFSKFDTEGFEKATLLQNRLFGILCKSAIPKGEARPMFLEAAFRKVFLIATTRSVEPNLFEHFQDVFLPSEIFGKDVRVSLTEEKKSEPPQKSSDKSANDFRHVSLKFPSFESAFQALRFFRNNPIGWNFSFSPYRCTLRGGDVLMDRPKVYKF